VQADDRVWRVAPDGRLRLIATGGFLRRASHADGIPARQAWLGDVTDAAVAADGTIYLAAGCRIREIGSDGIIRALAGREECRTGGDSGEPFRGFEEAIIGLTAAPDGAAIVLDGVAVWRVGLDGLVTRLMSRGRISFDAVDTLADGSLLVGGLSGVVRRITPGRVETLTRHGSPLLSAFDGDGARIESWFSASDVAGTADGGWLAAQGDRVRYVAPAQPAVVAIAIAPATIRHGLPLRVSPATTAAAHVVLIARVRGRETGSLTVDVPAGHTTVVLPGGSARHVTEVSATATSASPPAPTADDRVAVLAGIALPWSVPNRIMARWTGFTRAIGGGAARTRCHRFSPGRIDCAAVQDACQYVVAFKLRGDGLLTGRDYREPRGPRCRFLQHPRWRGARYGIEIPLTQPPRVRRYR
jgi:hypothetical protein